MNGSDGHYFSMEARDFPLEASFRSSLQIQHISFWKGNIQYWKNNDAIITLSFHHLNMELSYGCMHLLMHMPGQASHIKKHGIILQFLSSSIFPISFSSTICMFRANIIWDKSHITVLNLALTRMHAPSPCHDSDAVFVCLPSFSVTFSTLRRPTKKKKNARQRMWPPVCVAILVRTTGICYLVGGPWDAANAHSVSMVYRQRPPWKLCRLYTSMHPVPIMHQMIPLLCFFFKIGQASIHEFNFLKMRIFWNCSSWCELHKGFAR
jgi:hypothetical protein